MSELNDILASFSELLAAMDPEIAEILEALRTGRVGEVDGMQRLLEIVQRKDLISAVEQTALGVFQPDPDVPLVFQPEGRQPRLNPLMEAMIAERVQYDGDVPELRTGPLPAGATPAVPVRNPSRDPVALGIQLEQASEMVAGEIAEAQQGHIQMIEDKAGEQNLDEEGKIALYQEHLPGLPLGVPGYQPGSLPVPRKVETPTGSALARLTPEERQQKAWKALSTTQGRRSALQVIEELVLSGLRNEGFSMDARVPERGPANVKAYAEWKIRLSGPEAMQTQFSFMDAAAKGLLRKLVDDLDGLPSSGLVLELTAINTVDVRQVGWAARVVEV